MIFEGSSGVITDSTDATTVAEFGVALASLGGLIVLWDTAASIVRPLLAKAAFRLGTWRQSSATS